MNKYIRISSAKMLPRHSSVKFLYCLDEKHPRTTEEYVDCWKIQVKKTGKWTQKHRAEAIASLDWLIEQKLAKLVE